MPINDSTLQAYIMSHDVIAVVKTTMTSHCFHLSAAPCLSLRVISKFWQLTARGVELKAGVRPG